MPSLAALYRYPLKSAATEVLSHSLVGAQGLLGDRRWMLVDVASGRFLTQRALPAIGRITALWQVDGSLRLQAPGLAELQVAVPGSEAARRPVTVWSDSLEVPDAGDEAAQWLQQVIGQPCRLVQVPEVLARQVDQQYAQPADRVGFADGFPLLLISQASLDDLSARVGRSLEMLRFRPNLVVTGCEPYAEDQWRRIRIGDLEFELVKGCSRCILTTLDPQTGERSSDREPLTTLKTYREREGEVYFGQNVLPRGCGELRLGQAVEILD